MLPSVFKLVALFFAVLLAATQILSASISFVLCASFSFTFLPTWATLNVGIFTLISVVLYYKPSPRLFVLISFIRFFLRPMFCSALR